MIEPNFIIWLSQTYLIHKKLLIIKLTKLLISSISLLIEIVKSCLLLKILQLAWHSGFLFRLSHKSLIKSQIFFGIFNLLTYMFFWYEPRFLDKIETGFLYFDIFILSHNKEGVDISMRKRYNNWKINVLYELFSSVQRCSLQLISIQNF